MSRSLVPRAPQTPAEFEAPSPEALAAEAAANAAAAVNPRTARAYATQLRQLRRWAAEVGTTLTLPLPPMLVVAYIATLSLRRRAPSSVSIALWAIGRWHEMENQPSPIRDKAVREARRGYQQRWLAAGKRERRAVAFTLAQVEGMACLPAAHPKRRELRDRAILLLSIALAARRSELVALRVEDVKWHEGGGGCTVRIARSKTDQAGQGTWLAVPTGIRPMCAASALQDWMALARPTGPLFCRLTRSDCPLRDKPLLGGSVSLILQDLARRLGDPNLPPSAVSGHSPRATLVTLLMAAGVDSAAIAKHTRHRSLDTMRRYDRGESGLGADHVLRKLFLKR